MKVRHRGFARSELIMMGNGIIALEGSLTLLPWPLTVNIDVKDTSVLVQPSQRKG